MCLNWSRERESRGRCGSLQDDRWKRVRCGLRRGLRCGAPDEFPSPLRSADQREAVEKVYAALADGGRAVTLEFVPNDDRVSPLGVAGFSLVMLAGTPSGDAYTFAEFDRMFKNAGFSKSEIHELPQVVQQLIVSQK